MSNLHSPFFFSLKTSPIIQSSTKRLLYSRIMNESDQSRLSILDQLSDFSGRYISWVTTILVILICTDVFLRYLLNNSKTWIIELEWHLFALIFLIGAANALREDKHVRVDVFYHKFSEKKKAIINLIGTGFLLIPWCTIIIFKAFDYGMNSLAILEGSPNPGGLPARYIVKFSIALGFLLLLLQAISVIIKNIKVLRSK